MTRRAAPNRKSRLLDDAPLLRERERADGSTRLWWEPNLEMRQKGAQIVEFDPNKPGHAVREARALHKTWTKIVQGKGPVKPVRGNSMNDLIADYRASLVFKLKPASTQRVYASDLKQIAEKWGPQPVALFDKPTIARWLEAVQIEKSLFRARALRAMLSTLMGHAELRGWRPENTNPCLGLRNLRVPPSRWRAATWDEFDAAVQAARALHRWSVVAALHLAVMAGQRQYDILRTAPDDFFPARVDGITRPVWIWQIVQSKRGKFVQVPIHREAEGPVRLQLMRSADGPGTLLWDEATGKSYTPDRFGHVWAKVRALATKSCPSIASLQWRDLRRTFGNLSRAGGATKGDTADVLGNTAATDPRLMRTYMASQLATTLRAVSAVKRPTKKER